MAWPCISRVCCLARFWSQLDKSDLSVPLTTQNYSDIAQQEVRSVTQRLSSAPEPGERPAARGSLRTRTEPRAEQQPFPGVTQYKQDYKPWPIPRKETFPWMSNSVSADRQHGPGQRGVEERRTSSYREEYRPWTGAKPAKSARKNPPAQYSSPGTEATHIPRETSYQAAYSGDPQRSVGPHQGEHAVPSAAANIQPAAVPQPFSTVLQAAAPPGASILQQSGPSERGELSGTTKGEEQLVRTKLPPNPSAVFQSGSRVSNI